MYPFGDWFTSALRDADMSQADLRRKMAALDPPVEVTEGAVSQWANGIARPRREHAEAILAAIDASDALRLEAHAVLAQPRRAA